MRKNLVVRESSFVVVCSASGIVRSIPLMHHRKALPGEACFVVAGEKGLPDL